METISSLLILGAVVLLSFVLIKIISLPMRGLLKLLINTALGYIALFILNFFGEFFGFTLGLNFVNAVIVGFLGVPGVILLTLLKLFF